VFSELAWVYELLALWNLEVARFITVSFKIVEVGQEVMELVGQIVNLFLSKTFSLVKPYFSIPLECISLLSTRIIAKHGIDSSFKIRTFKGLLFKAKLHQVCEGHLWVGY
jgi:hypothetical protein